MEANLLASLPLYLGVEAQTVPVHPLHIGSGVIGGDQPSSVPGAACGQENRNKVTCNKKKICVYAKYMSNNLRSLKNTDAQKHLVNLQIPDVSSSFSKSRTSRPLLARW